MRLISRALVLLWVLVATCAVVLAYLAEYSSQPIRHQVTLARSTTVTLDIFTLYARSARVSLEFPLETRPEVSHNPSNDIKAGVLHGHIATSEGYRKRFLSDSKALSTVCPDGLFIGEHKLSCPLQTVSLPEGFDHLTVSIDEVSSALIDKRADIVIAPPISGAGCPKSYLWLAHWAYLWPVFLVAWVLLAVYFKPVFRDLTVFKR